MIAAAAALCGSVFADTAIQSANVVGYSTQAVEGDAYYMVAAQFEDVSGDVGIDMNKVISMTGISAVGYDDLISDGACISVLVDGDYKFYYFTNEAIDADEHPISGDIWADIDGVELTDADKLSLGNGFWFSVPAISCAPGATITVAGQVSKESSLKIDFPGSEEGAYTIIANPFPLPTDLRTVKTTGIVAVGYDDLLSDGACISPYVNGDYGFYYYTNEAIDADENPISGDVWADIDGIELTDDAIIPVGVSFWITAYQNGSLEFFAK